RLMSLVRDRRGAPEELGGPATEQSVALVWPLLVVERHEAVERSLHCRPTGEVLSAERDAPVLVQDRPLAPLHEAIGPGMPRFGARVPNAETLTGLIEGALELRAAIGQDTLQGPAGPTIDRQQQAAQIDRRRLGGELRQQPGDAVRGGRITGRDLPDL